MAVAATEAVAPVTPTELLQELPYLLDLGIPIWIWGSPGGGKTSIIKKAAEDNGFECPTLPPAVTLDPTDLRGIPYLNTDDESGNRTSWAVPDFWPSDPDWKGVIFVDELPQAPPLVQSGFMQLTYGGRLGSYIKPEKAVFVVAGNRREDRAGTHAVITPLLNRFMHRDLVMSAPCWQKWAREEGLSSIVRTYLAAYPQCLSMFDPSSGERAFPSPRSWEMTARVVDAAPENRRFSNVSGIVGVGQATELEAFITLRHQLPDRNEIYTNPETATVPDDPSVTWALCGAIADDAKQLKMPQLKAAMRYASRIGAEYGVLLVRDMAQVSPQVLNTPEGAAWLKNNRDVLVD